MILLVIGLNVLSLAFSQRSDAGSTKILKEQRFDAGDGRFGSAFAAEDGTVFREETGADGERIGQYSYIGQDGNTITVKYSAGKDGFRILEGSHIPEGATGQQSAPFNPNVAQQNQQQQAFVNQDQRQVQQPSANQINGDFNPFINPADPSHRDLRTNTNAAQFRPQQQLQQPLSQQQQQPPNPSFSFQQRTQTEQVAVQQQPRVSGPSFRQPQQPPPSSFRQPQQPTASSPLNNFQGNLNLNRFDTGFNFEFSS